jgi:23S rRNA (guanosine2251-2'-O)-methyltransferase
VIVFGINAVREALRAGRLERALVAARADERLTRLVSEISRQGIQVEHVASDVLDRETRQGVHQGVVGRIRAAREWSPSELIGAAAAVPLLVVLDGIEDPHNVGAILRSCDAAGVDGVIRQTRRAAPLEGAAAKVSAGAIAHVRLASVVNITRALEEIKALGVWTVGLDAEGPATYDQVDLTLSTALVVGAEGTGLRRLVRESCDWLVRIPMLGHVESLNVSVATGVVLFEARRQRRAKAGNRP